MALQFDGSSARVDYPSIYIPVGNPFSFACRFKLTSATGNQYLLLIESGENDFGFTAWLREDSGQQSLAVTCSSTISSTLKYAIPQSFPTNTWYDLVVTWDGAASATGVHIYLNGQELSYATSTDGTPPLRAQNGNWLVGGRATDNLRNLNGCLADLGAWSSIISANERANYSAGRPPATVRSADLVFDVRFIEGNTTENVTSAVGALNGTPIAHPHPTFVSNISQITPIAIQTLASDNNSPISNAIGAQISSPHSPIIASLSAEITTTPSSTVTLTDQYEGGNTDVTRTIIEAPDSLSPTVTVYARPNVNVEGALPNPIYYSLAFKISGILGKMPKFRLNLSHSVPYSLYGSEGWPVAWRPWFSYDEITWHRMDNSSVTGGFQEVSNSTSFSQNTVYFATRPPYNPSRVRAHIDSIKFNPFVSEPPSSTGNDFVYGLSSATTRDGDGLPVPALELISYRISDDATSAADGSPKRKAVFIAGQHASKDQGNWQLQSFVDFLIDGGATANALLKNWEFFIYPMVNPSGRWGNAYRGTLQQSERDQDPNRDWPGGNSSGRLDVVEATRTAIEVDTGNSISAFIDFHGRFRDPDSIFRFPNVTNDAFISHVNSVYPVVSVVSTTAGGVSETFYRDVYNVPLSITSEGAGFVTSISDYAMLGEALAKGLHDSFEAGLFQIKLLQGTNTLPSTIQAAHNQNVQVQDRGRFVSEFW
ncbi:LamG-like jellyroll fold domain-containing protein [Pelagibius sp. Alg239-R121]|uniref:LamG-like jellyroll fold domain-containing protein n=1 Tax=Pelagibius sp. Alg239-R121 TaxID=2993448 RepID=UPI0024A6890E|nr:LamG-like jellyroll fold domain-containing protein [Pelagibius sp. Alg239-R121]